MNVFWDIIRKKSRLFVIGTAVYFIVLVLLHWHFSLSWNELLFLIGGAIGIYFLDAAEVIFRVDPSPFRTIVFMGLFAIVGFFIITSSGSFLASGLVLSLYLTQLLWQFGEWMTLKNLNRWYQMLAEPVTPQNQFVIMCIFTAVFIFQTVIFIRS